MRRRSFSYSPTNIQFNTILDCIISDLNECALSRDTCIQGQTCENTMGSYVCRRMISCGTGYTLDQATQQCQGQSPCIRSCLMLLSAQFCSLCSLCTHDSYFSVANGHDRKTTFFSIMHTQKQIDIFAENICNCQCFTQFLFTEFRSHVCFTSQMFML